jgi:hypothetical protein
LFSFAGKPWVLPKVLHSWRLQHYLKKVRLS